jgi:hypothetical protein
MRFTPRRRGALLAALWSVVAIPLRAQSVGNMMVTDVRNTVGDVWAVWASPFHAGAKDCCSPALP